MADTEDNIRIIKKYPNRRIYDTHLSQYIKIDDIRDMILEGTDFKVIDTNSKEDVTRSVLLQIILEQESDNNPLFSSENLKHFIRYYGRNQSDIFSAFLDQSLQLFSQQQEQLSELFKQNPLNNFNQFNQKNMEIWQGFQDKFFNSFKTSKKNMKDKK